MEQAGYLEHTTAKRLDCIRALEDFLAPMRRHREQGITSDMYLGCFKTFIHSIVDVIETREGTYEDRVQARRQVHPLSEEVAVCSPWNSRSFFSRGSPRLP